ncbi:MAG TPA: MFS transporter [Sphingomonadaceae bacterium]|nr:MFS transporter [Sphingomonadaceae bacterium]
MGQAIIRDGAAADLVAGSTPLTSARGWYTVYILAAVSMLAQVDRGVISLLVEPMKRDLHLTDTEVSVLIGFAFTFFYMMVGPPMSRVTDRSVRKLVIAGGLGIWSFATLLCGLAQNFWALFFSRALVGGGESVNGPASFSMIADAIARDRLPRAYAILNAGVMGGMALSMVVGGVLMGLLLHVEPFHVPGIGIVRNWQLIFPIIGIPGLLLALLILLTVPEPIRKGARKPKGYPFREVVRFVVSQRAIHFPLLAGVMLMSVQSFGLGAWAPAFYDRTYGWGPEVVGPLIGTTALVSSMLGLWLGTHLTEWLGKRRDDANLFMLLLAQGLAFPFGLLSPLMPNPWLALAFSAVGALFGVMGGPAYNAAIQIVTPNAMRGQVNAMYLFLISAIGGAVGPTLVALITDNIAGSEAQLRYVLVAVRLLLGPLAVFLIWLSVAPYGRLYRQQIEEEG